MRVKFSFLISILCLCLCVLVCVGCGRKGRPRPPEEIAPGEVLYFTAMGTLEGVQLSWQAPVTDARGEPLLNLAGFVVKKRSIVDKGESDFEDIAEMSAKASANVMSQGAKSDDSKYGFLDRDVAPGKRYEYVVHAVDENGAKGRFSPIMRVTYIGESSIVTRSK